MKQRIRIDKTIDSRLFWSWEFVAGRDEPNEWCIGKSCVNMSYKYPLVGWAILRFDVFNNLHAELIWANMKLYMITMTSVYFSECF